MGTSKNRNWVMAINWGRVTDECESVTSLAPTQAEIEAALDNVEKDIPEEELYSSEADAIEQFIITRLLKIIRKNRGKDVKKKPLKEVQESNGLPGNVDVQFFGPQGNMGNLKDLKDMGFDIDPSVMENIGKSLMENMFGKKSKKKKSKDDEEEDDKERSDDEDRGSSFYT